MITAQRGVVGLVVKRFVAGAVAVSAFGVSACSGSQSGPPPPFLVYPSPSASASANAGATSTPVSTSTPTPIVTAAPGITGSLTSITVCAEQQMTCADDLNFGATSGEGAVVFVKGVLGTLSYVNAGGAAVGTITSQVYATMGNETEYEVFYRSASANATTDTLTIADAGSHSSLTIPVSIVDAGYDAGSSAFSLTTMSGIPCPGHQMMLATQTPPNTTIEFTSSNASVVSVAQNGSGSFTLGILGPGTGYAVADSGPSTVVYPVNVPVAGFTSNC